MADALNLQFTSIKLPSARAGVEIQVEDWGGKGPTCVILHGLADGAFLWRNFANKLSSLCRCLAIDLRGHGSSSRSLHGSYSFDEYVRDVDDVLCRFNAGRYLMIGHGFGGSIAARIVDQKKYNIVGVVLVDCGPDTNFERDVRLHDRILKGYRLYETPREYAELLISGELRGTNLGALTAMVEGGLSRTRDGLLPKYDPRIAASLLEQRDDSWWWKSLAKCAVPVLLVRSAFSQFLSQHIAEQMISALSYGKLELIERPGHLVITDNSDDLYQAVSSFIVKINRLTDNRYFISKHFPLLSSD